MIKFFRKIRQNLIMQNKTSKYFKYAIGEIVLVVIGIIIAVQINTWVNTSKLKEDNKVYLGKMINELELNKERMTKLISNDINKVGRYIGLEEAIKNCDSLLKMTYRGLKYSDTLFIFNNSLGAGGSYLNLHSGVYEELINTGKLYTIGSDSLETTIKNYYLRCEREDLYNRGNTVGMENGFDLIKSTYLKLLLDHDNDPENFDIKNYKWFTNPESKAYQDLQIALSNIASGQSNNMFKMKQIIAYSDSLIVKIKKELKQ